MIAFLIVALPIESDAQQSGRRSVTIRPNVEMQFQWVEPGQFLMGSPEGERDRDKDEGPQALVTLTRGYFLGIHEVTQRQWQAVMGQNPAMFQQGEGAENRPVESVSWNDCVKYARRLSDLGLGTFRLPTEAEWEYACRAGTSSRFYWGDTTEPWEAYPHAWTNSRSFATTHPVGTKPANPWGLFDMSGNVWEWCHDWYARYPESERIDPVGPLEGHAKVFRGGSYYDFPHSLRSANRHRHKPDQSYTAIGLRLVWEPVPVFDRKEISVPLPGGVSLRLVRIPSGSFTMGSGDDEQGRQRDEGPVRRVKIEEAFYMGRFEITQAQWVAVMGENPSTFQRLEEAPDLPVERVSWQDAQAFLARVNAPENRVLEGHFALPTEAEWEYACRAASSDRFPWGEDDGFSELQKHAWFNSRAEGKPHPVGTKKPNAWGLYDMHGNVWEWCDDRYAPYGNSDEGETKRVIRGGSWFNEPEALRSANRHRHPADSRQTNLGFRVVWRASNAR